jgi:hypothetical protein
LPAGQVEVDFLDLSLLTSEYGRRIHPCKGCVSTAMPLCHWPCSCYPEPFARSGQRLDERDLRALGRGARRRHRHADALVQHLERAQADDRPPRLRRRRQSRSDLDARQEARAGEGRSSSRAGTIRSISTGRVYGLVVHGDVAGIEGSRRRLSDWLDWMGLVSAGDQARLDRFIGYYEPYATSHDVLDEDRQVQEETRNVARAVAIVTAGDARQARSSAPARPCRGRGRNERWRSARREAGRLAMLHCSKVRSNSPR